MKLPRVTRTMLATDATFVVVDKTSSEVKRIKLLLPRTYKSDDKLIKVAQAKISKTQEDIIVLRVVEKSEKKFFCKMLEDRFFDESEKEEIN